MTTLKQIRTDWVIRVYYNVDATPSVLDCFVVELPPYTVGGGLCVAPRESKNLEDLAN